MLLVDEIVFKHLLRKLVGQSFPEMLRMILILNPKASSKENPLILPSSFLHVTLTTPYRSTIAITRLARFIAKCKGLAVPEGDFGSDVEGTKPLLFDVGRDERKMKEALEHCSNYLGDNVTILCDRLPGLIDKMVEDQVKREEGPWDHYDADNFYGWEAKRVVAVATGRNIMELITRARTHLVVILVDDGKVYFKTKSHFQQAANEGLVDIVHLSANNRSMVGDEDENSDVWRRK